MWKQYGLILLGGLAFSLGYPSILGFTIPLGPLVGHTIVLYFLLSQKSIKHNILSILTYGSAVNYSGFYWISKTLSEFGELSFIVSSLVSSLFGIIAFSYFWLIPLTRFILRKFNKQNLESYIAHHHFVIISAFIATLLEYYFPQQFDVFIGQSWIVFDEYLGFASLGGVVLYSFFCYLTIFTIIHFKVSRIKQLSTIIMVALFILLNPIVALLDPPELNGKEVTVRLVQPSITSWMKVQAEKGSTYSASTVISKYRRISSRGTKKPIDLIIWPETAYPYGLTENGEDTYFPTLFYDIIYGMKSELFFGGYDVRKQDSKTLYESEYNTGFHVGKDGKLKDLYHKHVLIPFGESLPFGPLNKFIQPYIANMAFFIKGTRFPLFQLDDGARFISIICYEYLKPTFVSEYINSVKEYPHFIINITNDSWYAFPEQEQHLFLGKWRAMEFGIPVIRSTNTGISTIILPDGQELERLEHLVADKLDVTIPLYKAQKTLYAQFGFFIVIVFTLLIFLFSRLLLKLNYEEI
jgi:apolipoprotein N-acyltransferase